MCVSVCVCVCVKRKFQYEKPQQIGSVEAEYFFSLCWLTTNISLSLCMDIVGESRKSININVTDDLCASLLLESHFVCDFAHSFPLAFSLFSVCGINDDNFLSDTDKDEGKKVMQFIVIQSIQSSCCAQNALLFSLSAYRIFGWHCCV